MTKASGPKYEVMRPDLQVSFHLKLQKLRADYLHEALRTALGRVDIRTVDRELAQHVKPAALSKVASFGLRGEIVLRYPVSSRPRLPCQACTACCSACLRKTTTKQGGFRLKRSKMMTNCRLPGG